MRPLKAWLPKDLLPKLGLLNPEFVDCADSMALRIASLVNDCAALVEAPLVVFDGDDGLNPETKLLTKVVSGLVAAVLTVCFGNLGVPLVPVVPGAIDATDVVLVGAVLLVVGPLTADAAFRDNSLDDGLSPARIVAICENDLGLLGEAAFGIAKRASAGIVRSGAGQDTLGVIARGNLCSNNHVGSASAC